MGCCKCCCCEEEGFDEEWEYEYESIEEEEDEGDGKPSDLTRRDDDDDDDKKPAVSIEMKELVSTRSSKKNNNNDDEETNAKIIEKPQQNPSDLREQQQHHKWECVRWVREIEDVHKGDGTTEPARSATIIVHEPPPSPEKRKQNDKHRLKNSEIIDSENSIKNKRSAAFKSNSQNDNCFKTTIRETTMTTTSNSGSNKNKNKLRILNYDGPLINQIDAIVDSPTILSNNHNNNTPNALSHHNNSSALGSRPVAPRFKGHSPYKVAASEISQFPFPPMAQTDAMNVRLHHVQASTPAMDRRRPPQQVSTTSANEKL